MTEPFHKLLTALEGALERFRTEAEQSIVEAAALILEADGKVVVTGVGKSGIVGHKTAATLASTGTPAVFLNAAEALHGDMGVVCPGDVVLMISHSGETDELLRMLPSMRKIGVRSIGILGKPECTLSGHVDLVIPALIDEEGDLLNLAPMCSSTLSLVAGDALAATIQSERGFGKEDFAVLHPGGFLGRRLLLRASDVMHRRERVGTALREASFEEVLRAMTEFPLGLVCIVSPEDALLGVLSEGDVRRIVLEKRWDVPAGELMTTTPVAVREAARLGDILDVMEDPGRKIYAVPVLDENDRLVGVVRMHDVLGS